MSTKQSESGRHIRASAKYCLDVSKSIAVEDLPEAISKAHLENTQLEVFAVDKFPKMVNYVVPAGVRIADASRIRLGAYLGDGTTVMHEGFINFNAGALGPNMVEGRISQGVTLGSGTDLGGSASTMGTLSGGGNITISVGENCLIGANMIAEFPSATAAPSRRVCTLPLAWVSPWSMSPVTLWAL